MMDKKELISINGRKWKYEDIEFWKNPVDGAINAIIMFNGKKTRLRAGMLVVKDGDKILLGEEEAEPGVFSIPGGSFEKGETPIDAAVRETKEEVGILVDNARETNRDYCSCHTQPKKWVVDNVARNKWWYNYYTCLVIAEYKGKFNGHVADIDKDTAMKKSSKWYKIADVVNLPSFKEQWKNALIDAGYYKEPKNDSQKSINEDILPTIQVIKIEDYPENGYFYDVISQVKDIVYGFINKKTGERVDDREFIHNHPNIRDIYHTNTDPCVTLRNKLGICMDQSLAIKYLFNQLHPDYICKLYALTKGRYGHCVPCICTPSGEWFYIENAWDKERGIHGPLYNEDALKEYLTDIYDYQHNDVQNDSAKINDFNTNYLVESCVPLVENISITPEQRKYSEYLIGHISNTKKGYFWIKENAPEMLKYCNKKNVENNLIVHDESKYSPEEYNAYSNYFYGKVRTPEIKKAFDIAWLHHWTNNKHHPEYWHGLPMPEDYIIEMICDWWSFSWRDNKLGEIFNFFNNVAIHDERKNMNSATVKRVKELLDILHQKLKEHNLI